MNSCLERPCIDRDILIVLFKIAKIYSEFFYCIYMAKIL